MFSGTACTADVKAQHRQDGDQLLVNHGDVSASEERHEQQSTPSIGLPATQLKFVTGRIQWTKSRNPTEVATFFWRSIVFGSCRCAFPQPYPESPLLRTSRMLPLECHRFDHSLVVVGRDRSPPTELIYHVVHHATPRPLRLRLHSTRYRLRFRSRSASLLTALSSPN